MRNKCLGVFLVFITVPLVMVSILQLANGNFLRSSFYKEFLTKNKIYDKVVLILPKDSSSDNIITAFSASISAPWLKTNIEYNLDAGFNFLNKKTPTFDFSVDATIVKNNPDLNIPASIINVLPDTLSMTSYNSFLQNTKDIATKNTTTTSPEEVDKQIADFTSYQAKFTQNTKNAQTAFYYFKIGMWVVYGLTILMLLIIALAARRYWPAILRWTGFSLFIPGVILLGTSFAFPKIFINLLHPINNLKLEPPTKDLLTTIYNGLINVTSFNTGRISLLVTLIGLFIVITSYVLPLILKTPPMPKPEPKKPSNPAPTPTPAPAHSKTINDIHPK